LTRRLAAAAAVLAALALAGCDGAPFGGEPPGDPVRTVFSSCPRLQGTYAFPPPSGDGWSTAHGVRWGHDDELSIEEAGDGGLRFTWRQAAGPDPSEIVGIAPDVLVRYRWSIGQDDRTDDDFVQWLLDSRFITTHGRSVVVSPRQMHCEHGWLSVPAVPGGPEWPGGSTRSAQFTIDRHGVLLADFPVHVSQHGFFAPNPLWCGHACRDYLNGGHEEHDWFRADRKLARGAVSLELPYDEGHDVMGDTPAASDAARDRWHARLPGLRATLTRVRVAGQAVEMTFAADDRRSLVAAVAGMRRLSGLQNVVVRRFSGGEASPQTLTVTAGASAALLAATR
jgi:hypothetical protein